MESFAIIAFIVLSILFFIAFASFSWISSREGERRATRLSFILGVLGSSMLLAAILLPLTGKMLLLGIFLCLGIACMLLFILPIGHIDPENDLPEGRFDERDIVFARARLSPGSPNFEAYYQRRPENVDMDQKFRRLPGLLSPSSLKANSAAFASASASFQLTHAVRDEVDGAVSTDSSSHSPEQNTSFIKGYTRYLGAVSVGITPLEPYQLYSHIGRGSGEYGAPITLDHKYAIAFTVEMDHQIMGTAPEGPVVMESARQYVEAAKIAITLGTYLRLQGYPARAHIDGNYRVIAPLVARDAGLGEIGRMGILMTPELGPRVRLGVVTTDFPLIPDKRIDGSAMIDFCTLCKKCAENCPSRSIPFEGREEIDGTWRWRLDADTCFRYWNTSGTDCGVCMAVCPYSHPDNWAHNAIRWAIQRSGFARRAALWMDDTFYGRKPGSRKFPEWLPS